MANFSKQTLAIYVMNSTCDEVLKKRFLLPSNLNTLIIKYENNCGGIYINLKYYERGTHEIKKIISIVPTKQRIMLMNHLEKLTKSDTEGRLLKGTIIVIGLPEFWIGFILKPWQRLTHKLIIHVLWST